MENKVYKLFFDYNEIRLDSEGIITNENTCMYIAEYEWDEDTETVGEFTRRVNALYRRHGEDLPMDITVEEMEEMETLDEVFETPQDAIDALEIYLEDYKIWRTIRGGYYDPDEYVCEGLEDRDDMYYRVKAIAAVEAKRVQEA